MARPPYRSAEEAEEAFYDAFEAADIDDMMAVWADEDGIVCIHPNGPRLEGKAAVRRSWEEIFANSRGMRFSITQRETFADKELTVHVVYEHIRVGREERNRSMVVATNAYRHTESGWRMVLHHASPCPSGERAPAGTLH